MSDLNVKIWNDQLIDGDTPVVVLELEDERAVLTPDQADAVAQALIHAAVTAVTGSNAIN